MLHERITVTIGGIVCNRLSGTLEITAAEESATTAKFTLTPANAAEILALDARVVTIDIEFGGLIYRRFTGSIAGWDFTPDQRMVEIVCRSAYQDTIKSCASKSDVLALLGGNAVECDALATWSDSNPDPSAYFTTLLDTVQGSAWVDGSGVWRYVPWLIGSPAAAFTGGEIFDATPALSGADKSDLPLAINAKLTVRVVELCAVDVPLHWVGLDYVLVGRLRGAWPTVSAVSSCLDGLSGWYIKGEAAYTHPLAGYEIPTEGGGHIPMMIANPTSICIAMDVTLYHRWYRYVDVVYTATIDVGGSADIDTSISAGISTEWDSSGWETASSGEPSTGIYAAHDPFPDTVEKTGYEALAEPWPGSNASMMHYPDIGTGGIALAAQFVAARAVRLAAAGLRRRRLKFQRPVDPRWSIGHTLSASACGVTGIGQVVGFVDSVDFDSGVAVTDFEIACPAAGAAAPSVTALAPLPAGASIAPPNSPTLGNFVGADTETSTLISDDALIGYLCNTTPGATGYDFNAPTYIPQFRVIMPEIPAALRDPKTIEMDLNIVHSISGGSITIEEF